MAWSTGNVLQIKVESIGYYMKTFNTDPWMYVQY